MEKSLRKDDIRPPGKAVEPGIEWFLLVTQTNDCHDECGGGDNHQKKSKSMLQVPRHEFLSEPKCYTILP
jgi:hypothetical protein